MDGGKRGKTSGKGTKGQKARAGRKLRPEMRDIIKKIPKLRGRGKNSFLSIQTKPVVLKLKSIEEKFTAGEEINNKTLIEKGLLSVYKGKPQQVKVLLSAPKEKISAKLIFKGISVSKTAREAIEKAGGSIL